jgi:hypothetical protein
VSKDTLLWKKRAEQGDYQAALDFLSLLMPISQARVLIRSLRTAPVGRQAAKDLLRASGLPLLMPEEASVKNDLKKIAKGKPLSPVLLIRGDVGRSVPLTVADGYHRICAVCHFDEFAGVASQLVDLE